MILTQVQSLKSQAMKEENIDIQSQIQFAAAGVYTFLMCKTKHILTAKTVKIPGL